jgi:predicted RNA methylase
VVDTIDAEYVLASADDLPYEDDPAAYVLMGPPFGSNLFYADMVLFKEAWLGEFTDAATEAVVDRAGTRTASR